MTKQAQVTQACYTQGLAHRGCECLQLQWESIALSSAHITHAPPAMGGAQVLCELLVRHEGALALTVTDHTRACGHA